MSKQANDIYRNFDDMMYVDTQNRVEHADQAVSPGIPSESDLRQMFNNFDQIEEKKVSKYSGGNFLR